MRITENWRLKSERYTLEGAQPTEIENPCFPPRPVQAREVEIYDFKATEPAEYVWATETSYAEAQ